MYQQQLYNKILAENIKIPVVREHDI